LSASEIRELSSAWKFKTDPADAGVKEAWYSVETDDSSWADVRSDAGSGFESQGFEGYSGVSWYRQKLTLPADLEKFKFAYLWFSAVGEEATIYINGKEAFEHSNKSTALPRMDLRQRPFFFDAKPFLPESFRGGENTIAVRVTNTGAPAGIWKPVRLVATDYESLPERPD